MFGKKSERSNDTLSLQDGFPFVDFEAIKKKLRLEARGLENGRADLPSSNATDLFPVEQEIIAAVDNIRRRGLAGADEHLRVYRERIEAGIQIGPEIMQVTTKTETDFRGTVAVWSGQLRNSRNDLIDSERDLVDFKQVNALNRTAFRAGGIWKWAAICAVVITIESVLNGFLFAEVHLAGLLGGAMVALMISVVNVGAASIAGHVFRNKNHVRFGRRLVGWSFLAIGVMFAAFFNFLVGHIRDVMALVSWEEAAGAAFQRIASGQLEMENLDSWLLTGIGIVIATVAGWKAYDSVDPYPGYGRVSSDYETKRENWRRDREDGFEQLIDIRNQANNELFDEYQKAKNRHESARSARASLLSFRGKRQEFLKHCDEAIGRLLQIYRVANIKVRSTPEPKHFGEVFHFPEEQESDDPPPISVDAMQKCSDHVQQAVERIHDLCKKAMDEFGDESGSIR